MNADSGRKLRGPKPVDGRWRCDHKHTHDTKQQAKACNWRNRSVRS
jgi:hypothetical protein